MTPLHPLAEGFFQLFTGLPRAHGSYSLPHSSAPYKGEKQQGAAKTLRTPPTAELWSRHLGGTYGLGVVPIRDDGTVRWGAIDVDRYTDTNLAAIATESDRMGLPLLICRTKSGGIHAYLFCAEDIAAELVRAKLIEWASALGFAGSEVFPKQTKLAGQSDFGNWINMPYFGGMDGGRYAVTPDGEQLTPDHFLEMARSVAVTAVQLSAIIPPADTTTGTILEEAPPCLVTLAKKGLSENRNLGLFAFGVYLKKRYGEDWQQHFDEINQRFVSPPLGHREVTQIATNLGKKDYDYKCNDQPIVACCNRQLCVKRKYGVAGERSRPTVRQRQLDAALQLLKAAAIEPWHTTDQRPFVSLTIRGRTAHLPCTSRLFRDWVIETLATANEGRPVSGEVVRLLIDHLAARALVSGPCYPVAVRTASGPDGAIYVDLADDQGMAVRIVDGAWELTTDVPVRFYRPATLRPLPVPLSGGSLASFWALVNVRDDDRALLTVWMLAALLPSGPYPVLVIGGEQGSAKTMLLRLLKMLLDPSVAERRGAPKDEGDLMIRAANAWLQSFDNLSYLPPWLSDSLCRLATGGALGKRQLYTDADEIVLEAQRPVVLNGIPELAARADLRDRSILLDLPAIPESQRRDEGMLLATFAHLYPRLLGAVYSALATSLQHLPAITLTSAPRMADFARFGVAVERALDWTPGTFLTSYAVLRSEASARAVEHDAVAAAIRTLVDWNNWESTATELLQKLSANAAPQMLHDRDWPRPPRALSTALRRAAPDLRALGIEVEFVRGDARMIRLHKPGRVAGAKLEEPI